ncbi:MAG: DNA polymerase III subunit epsilon [Pseudomonadota bacterium]
MREIVLDTETTGLNPREGHRIVEIGAVELSGHVPTGRTYHQYINPERDMPAEAFAVHGLGDDFLKEKPVFAQVVEAFLAFVGDAKLVIHNAAFDMDFINFELKTHGRNPLPMTQAIDTLAIARSKFPGAQNSLDALCRRFGVDNSGREKHGALLDSELLADVYLELLGGRQPTMVLAEVAGTGTATTSTDLTPPLRPKPLQPRLSAAEESAHRQFIEKLGDAALW